jgi:replicative DNA helicase
MANKPIHSIELEKLTLAGLLQYGTEIYPEIANFISEDDFQALGVHRVIFAIIKRRLEEIKAVTPTQVAQDIKNLGITFPEVDNVYEYLAGGLALIQINKDGVLDAIKDLKKVSVAREIDNAAVNIQHEVRKKLNSSPQEIIDAADRIYNSRITTFYGKKDTVNLFEGLKDKIEALGENPIENIGMMGPHPKLNELYGSLVRPGNITTVCARSGSYKTTFLLHYGTSLADIHKVPIIHLDNGEMSPDELQFRQMAALSGVPLHLIETGKWRRSANYVGLIRSTYPKLEKLKYHYVPVGGKSSQEMISIVRRLYYSLVGRGNPTALLFDYWKSYGEDYAGNKAEWERMGKITQDFKDFTVNEVPIGILAGLQGNRFAIITGKAQNQVVDDEGIASGGDRIIFHSSHFFILRRKTLDQLTEEQNRYGNCLLKQVAKCRHVGENVKDAINPVQMPDGSFKPNYVHFAIDNFFVQERGDLASTVGQIGQLVAAKPDGQPDDGDMKL